MAIQPPKVSLTARSQNGKQLSMLAMGLFAAIQEVVIMEAEAIAASGEAERERRHARFDAYTEKLIRATKGLLSEGASITDEAIGVGDALGMLTALFGGVREQL